MSGPISPAAQSALLRLARSRGRLRTALREPPAFGAGPALALLQSPPLARSWRLLRRWWRQRRPVSGLLRPLLRTADALLAGEPERAGFPLRTLRDGVARRVRRHPLLCLGLAAAATVWLLQQRSALRGVAAGLLPWLGSELQNGLLREAFPPTPRARPRDAVDRPSTGDGAGSRAA